MNLMGRVGGDSNPKFSGFDKEDSADNDDDPEVYMKMYEDVKSEIEKIDDNSDKVDAVSNRIVRAASSSDEKEVMKQLSKLMSDNTKTAESVKNQLQKLKLANDKASVNKAGSSLLQMRINEWNSTARKFQTATNKFQASLTRFNNELKSRQKRLITAVDQDLSKEQVDELANDPAKAQVYLEQAFQMQVGDAMMDRLAEIETRTQAMEKIYESLEELRLMWNDLHLLTNEQQELMDNIDNNVQKN